MGDDDLPGDVRAAVAVMAHPQPMRRGCLGERFMKCGKAACACHRDPDARHGPYFVLTRGVEHTTRSRFLTPQQVALARAQVARAAEFREQLEHYWRACERWADSELQVAAADTEVGKKGASEGRSRRRSRPRSKRLLAARAIERCLNADTSDHAGATLRCDCGKMARYAGRHEKTYQSALGPLRLKRAYTTATAARRGCVHATARWAWKAPRCRRP